MSRRKAKPLTKKQGMSLANLPVPDFLTKKNESRVRKKKRKKDKHKDAFLAYAKWYSTPAEMRDPPTKTAFAKLWKLPSVNYMYHWEDEEEFLHLASKHYWKWMFSILPDISHAAYQRAIAKTRGSSQDAKLLMELIGKRFERNNTPQRIQPLIMVGVDQNKIEELFTPTEYIDAAETTLERERNRKEREKQGAPKLPVESA